VQEITDALWGVVNEPGGTTSQQVRLEDVDFACKTGTAQTESFELQARLGKHLKENGWFIGIEPRRNPEIVVAALVQGAGWGSAVAPIVRDVVKAYCDKKTARTPQQANGGQPAAPGADATAMHPVAAAVGAQQ